MRHQTRSAFTLIEVAVLVAIVALLAAVLLPSLAEARDRAQTVACRTRLNELYKGHAHYGADNQGHFPHWDWWLWDGHPGTAECQLTFYPNLYAKTGGSRPADSSRWVEFGQIYRYMQDKETYFCPKDTKRRNGGIGSGGASGNLPIHSYARFMEPHYYFLWQKNNAPYPASAASWPYNGLLEDADFLSPDQISGATMGRTASANVGVNCTTTPDRVGMMFEEWPTTDELPGSTNPGYGYGDLNDAYSGPLVYPDTLAARHRNQAHILYWDGHTLLADTTQYNRYTYVNPLPFYGIRSIPIPVEQRYAAVVTIGARAD